VDEAAEAAGYDRALFHQTHKDNVPKIYESGFRLDIPVARASDNEMPDGIFLKPDNRNIRVGAADTADIRQLRLYVKLDAPLRFEDRAAFVRFVTANAPQFADVSGEFSRTDKQIAREVDALEEAAKTAPKESQDSAWNAYFEQSDVILNEGRKSLNEIAARARAIATEAVRRGHDGIIVTNDAGSFGRSTTTIVVLDPNQVKSADPVTRDESGNVIPLSQRFNPADDRITFSLSPSKQGASVGSMASQDQAAQTPSSSPGGLTEAEAKQYEAGRNRFGDLHPDKAADLWEALANDGVAFEFEGTWVLANPELQGIPSQIAVYGKSKLSSRAEKAYATKLFKSDLVPSVEAGVAAIRRVPTIRVSEFEMDGLNHQAASLPGPFHGDIRKLQKWSVPESELDALRSAPNSLVRDEIMGRLLEVYEPPQLKDYSHLSAADFEEMVRERLPSMPVEKVKLAVASSMRSRGMDWSDLKGSEFDVVAAIVRPFVRHEMTAYDQLLRNGAPKDEARSLVLDNVEATIEQWSRPNNEAAKVSQGGFNKGSDSSPGSLLETTSKPMPEATMVGGQWPNDNSPSPPTVNSFNPSASTAEAYNMKRADWVSKNPFPDGENEHETVRHTLAMWAAIGVNPAKYSPHPYISKIEIGRHKGSSKSDSTYFDLIASIKDGVDVSSIGDRYDEEAREVLQTVRLSDHPRPASSPFPADINLVVENGNWLDALNESIQKFSEVIESEAKQQTPKKPSSLAKSNFFFFFIVLCNSLF